LQTLFLSPAWLLDNGIRPVKVMQRRSDIAFFPPGSYFEGINLGPNLTESIHLVSPSVEETVNKHTWLQHSEFCACDEMRDIPHGNVRVPWNDIKGEISPQSFVFQIIIHPYFV
jgi:hypothetical protein